MKGILASLGMAVLLAQPVAANAQNFPSKPIAWIIPSGPGGTADGIARIVAEGVRKRLNDTPMVFDYVPGASGLLAQQRMLQAAPDGHTIFMSGITHILPMLTRPKQSIDMVNQLTPLARMTRSAYALMVSKDSGIKSVDDLVREAKKNPGGLFYGTMGPGSSVHLMTEHMRTVLGIDITSVPFKGEPPIYPEVIANRVQIYLSATPQTLIDNGAVALGTTGDTPWPFFPPMPPLKQAVPGLVYYAWSGLFLPKGVPDPIVRKLNAAITETLADPEIVKKLEKFGVEIWASSPEEFVAQIKSDLDRFQKVIETQKLVFED
jgi:tripartite-type tricarboxylate transporter receptor subunit TctC